MQYKGYELTNFTCAAQDLGDVKACFEKAIDLAMADAHFGEIGQQLMEDIFYLQTLRLLNKSPIGADKPFLIQEVKKNEPSPAGSEVNSVV